MKKMAFLLWIVGGLSVAIITVIFAIMNSSLAHVDLFFAEGDIAVFLVIMGSFLIGFFTCMVFMWLRRVLGRHRKTHSSTRAEERALVDEI